MKYAVMVAMVAVLFLQMMVSVCGEPVKPVSDISKKQMDKMREVAKWRERRIIYNDDSYGPLTNEGVNNPQEYLYGTHARMRPLIGTEVDSVFICSGATHVLSHTSSVAETYADIEDRYGSFGPDFTYYDANMKALKAQGTDMVQLTIDFCRKENKEVFYTYRVNDVHSTYEFCAIERSTWMREHPQYLMSTKQEGDKYPDSDPRRIWSALNFEIPEVRQYLLSIIKDVANRYDLDGIEIDYFRSPMFFRPNLENKPATKAQLAILTDFQRKVREIAEEAGRQRGRPMLVATRVPLTVSTCNHVGIGIERWLKDGLVDVLTTGGGYIPFGMPTKQLVKLGHKYDVPVYPCISGSGMRGGADYNSIEAWRGAASSAWAQGADGIYIFNYFPTETTPHLMELGDPKKLATMDKLFPIDNNVYRAGAHSQAIPWDDVIPVEVTGTKPVKLNLSIGDDIAAAAKSGRLREAKLMIQYEPPVTSGSLIASLNGHVLSQSESTVEGGRVTYKTDPGWYVKGRNSIIFKLPRGAETKRNIAVDEMGVSIKTSSTNVVLKPIGAPYQMSGSSTLMGMPAWVEIEWPVAHNIGEIVIYGGVPECADNPSTECTPLDYRLQYMKAGSWADIIPPVLNAPRYRDYRAPGKPSWNFKYSHEFSPISAKAVRLYVERSSDSGLRVTQAPMLPEEKRVTDIRGIKVFEARSGGKSASKTGSTAHTVCSVELRVSYKQ